MYDVITLGSATIDTFIKTDIKLEHHFLELPFGSKLLIKELQKHNGGGGLNTAITFSKNNLRTGFLGTLGNDADGTYLLSMIKHNKITFLGRIKGKTGSSIIIDKNNDRTILTFKGANDYAPANDFLFKSKWVYIASLTDNFFRLIKKTIKNIDSKIAFNPSNYMLKKGISIIKPILKKTDVLILNREEALLVTRKTSIMSAMYFLTKTVPTVAITSPEGVWISSRQINSSKDVLFLHSKKIKVIDSTGAGDAFASGFITGLIKEQELLVAVKMGVINAENCIKKTGATTNLQSELLSKALRDKRRFKIVG